MARKKTRKGNNKGQTQLERMREKLPAYLFNAEVMRFPKVTVPELQKRMFAKSKTTIYRLLKDLRLDKKSLESDEIEPLTNEEVGDYLISHLSVRQAFSLYDWALAQRFDKQAESAKKTGKKVTRGYGANGPVKREKTAVQKTQEDKDKEAEMAKQAVANSPFNGGQQPANVDYSTAEKVKSAILNGDLTPEQATEIAENILNGQKFTELNSTQSAYIAMMKRDSSFNESQWSLDWLYNHLLTSGSAQAEFYQVATGQKEPINLPASISKIMVYYKQNEGNVDISKVGESIDY